MVLCHKINFVNIVEAPGNREQITKKQNGIFRKYSEKKKNSLFTTLVATSLATDCLHQWIFAHIVPQRVPGIL